MHLQLPIWSNERAQHENYGECAGRPARRWWSKSTAMKEVRSTLAPSRACMFARTWAKRRSEEHIGQPLSFDKHAEKVEQL
jgi:hypothetical protein